MAENKTPYNKQLLETMGKTKNNKQQTHGKKSKIAGPPEFSVDETGRVQKEGQPVGVVVDDQATIGVAPPSRKFEFYQPTLAQWGWTELEYTIPHYIKSHVHPDNIDRANGGMLLLPTFRLPTLIHTRSANAKWLYEISHRNPVWMHPQDARRIGVASNDLIKVETEIGYFVSKGWVTEGIKPGIIAMSHHLGRWRLQESAGVNQMSSSLVEIDEHDNGEFAIRPIHGARAYKSSDPDTSRIWWEDVGVHQNITHAVHPDPLGAPSGGGQRHPLRGPDHLQFRLLRGAGRSRAARQRGLPRRSPPGMGCPEPPRPELPGGGRIHPSGLSPRLGVVERPPPGCLPEGIGPTGRAEARRPRGAPVPSRTDPGSRGTIDSGPVTSGAVSGARAKDR